MGDFVVSYLVSLYIQHPCDKHLTVFFHHFSMMLRWIIMARGWQHAPQTEV